MLRAVAELLARTHPNHRRRRPSLAYPLSSSNVRPFVLPTMAEREYVPQDTLSNTATTTLQTTAAGAILAGVQNTLRRQNVGAMGIITRSGHIIAIYGP